VPRDDRSTARSGYIILLQPQERRSKQPGDTVAAVRARRRLHDRGVTEPLLRAIAEMTAARPSDIVLDAGCGDGFYLGSLAGQTGFDAHGVDISTAAVDAAARRYRGCEWIVANADRFLPYADRSFSTYHAARMNASEFRVSCATRDAFWWHFQRRRISSSFAAQGAIECANTETFAGGHVCNLPRGRTLPISTLPAFATSCIRLPAMRLADRSDAPDVQFDLLLFRAA
jgi:SAM-dependent methyltransferase